MRGGPPFTPEWEGWTAAEAGADLDDGYVPDPPEYDPEPSCAAGECDECDAWAVPATPISPEQRALWGEAPF